MLGINPVRSIASALMLFEHLQNKVQSNELKEDSVQALFSGLVANTMASAIGMKPYSFFLVKFHFFFLDISCFCN